MTGLGDHADAAGHPPAQHHGRRGGLVLFRDSLDQVQIQNGGLAGLGMQAGIAEGGVRRHLHRTTGPKRAA